ncbi:hypothetical protein Dda_5145 [Drechslerella dactyloides]|uniref:Uncharacterized protein n=1 Tax=Drechslerella dactyloides TaxID=74499 RepID=A0AAD6NJX9_DREDA|nr:hypothetical protein Dda_5145 [Drechslerella dactyloides]
MEACQEVSAPPSCKTRNPTAGAWAPQRHCTKELWTSIFLTWCTGFLTRRRPTTVPRDFGSTAGPKKLVSGLRRQPPEAKEASFPFLHGLLCVSCRSKVPLDVDGMH